MNSELLIKHIYADAILYMSICGNIREKLKGTYKCGHK